MRWARALVLLLAVGSAAGAALVVRRAAPAAPHPLAAPQPLPQTEIRVLGRAIAAGELVEERIWAGSPGRRRRFPPMR